MLMSGGLDSLLAAKVALDEGIELIALNYKTVFCTCTPGSSSCSAAATAVAQLGIPLEVIDSSRDFIEIVKKPPHGYGSNMNPCIDCRIFMFKSAAKFMREQGASFLVTGEVLGERPMSQRKDAMMLIEREAGLEGLILRPLSAACLPPSIPEKEGWIDRSKLLSIRGRSRKPQIALAKEYGLNDYPCPAGGCRLTDPGFARRMRDLVEKDAAFTLGDVNLLKYGRHFRFESGAKLVVGRDEAENATIENLARDGDRVFVPVSTVGPSSILRGTSGEDEVRLAARIAARYCDKVGEAEVVLSVRTVPENETFEIEAAPASEDILAPVRL